MTGRIVKNYPQDLIQKMIPGTTEYPSLTEVEGTWVSDCAKTQKFRFRSNLLESIQDSISENIWGGMVTSEDSDEKLWNEIENSVICSLCDITETKGVMHRCHNIVFDHI